MVDAIEHVPLTATSLLRDFDFLDVRQQLAVHRAVDGLQRASVVIDARDDVHRRRLPPYWHRTPFCWMYQCFPFFFHVPWPKPPSESKTQERICFVEGSQPMTCIPAISIWPPI